MKKLNIKGFSPIEGLMVILVLVLVVGIGFYAKNKISDKASKAESSSSGWTIVKASDLVDSKNKTVVAPATSPIVSANARLVNDSTVPGGKAFVIRGNAGQRTSTVTKFTRGTNPSFDADDGALYEICVNLKTTDTKRADLAVSMSNYGGGVNDTRPVLRFDDVPGGYRVACGVVRPSQQYFAAKDLSSDYYTYLSLFVGNGDEKYELSVADIRVRKILGVPKIDGWIKADNVLTTSSNFSPLDYKDSIILNSQTPTAFASSTNFQRTRDTNEKLLVSQFPYRANKRTTKTCVTGKVLANNQNGREQSVIDVVGANRTRKNLTFAYSNGNIQTLCTDPGRDISNANGFNAVKATRVSGAPFQVEEFRIYAVN